MNARSSRYAARRRAIVATACLLLVFALVAPPEAATSESLPDEGNVESGEQLFEANCAMCHGSDGTGMGGMHPALTGAVDRLSAEGVAVTIRKGRDTTPPMPAFEDELTEGDVANLVAYLDSLPPGPRNFGPMQDGNMRDDGMMGDGMMGDGMMGDGMMGRMMDDGMMTGQMWLQMLVGLLLLLAVIAIIVALAAWVARKTARSSTPAQGDGDNARQVLDARYARGELSREDYLQARRDLSE